MGNGAKVVLVIALLAVVIFISREIKKDVRAPRGGDETSLSEGRKPSDASKTELAKRDENRRTSTDPNRRSNSEKPRSEKVVKDDKLERVPGRRDRTPRLTNPPLEDGPLRSPFPKSDDDEPNLVGVIPSAMKTGEGSGKPKPAVVKPPETDPKTGPDPKTDPKPSSDPKPEDDPKVEPKNDPKPDPKVEPKSEPSAPGYPKTHVIADGDTIWDLAEEYYGRGILFSHILEANGLDEDSLLKVGQSLKIPAPPKSKSSTPKPQPKSAAGLYVVVEGDSLYSIALEKLGSGERWTEIRDLNPNIDPDSLKIGARLKLPKN